MTEYFCFGWTVPALMKYKYCIMTCRLNVFFIYIYTMDHRNCHSQAKKPAISCCPCDKVIWEHLIQNTIHKTDMLLTWSSDHTCQVVIPTYPHPTLSLNAILLSFHVHNHHEHFQTKLTTAYFKSQNNMVTAIVLNVPIHFYDVVFVR